MIYLDRSQATGHGLKRGGEKEVLSEVPPGTNSKKVVFPPSISDLPHRDDRSVPMFPRQISFFPSGQTSSFFNGASLELQATRSNYNLI